MDDHFSFLFYLYDTKYLDSYKIAVKIPSNLLNDDMITYHNEKENVKKYALLIDECLDENTVIVSIERITDVKIIPKGEE